MGRYSTRIAVGLCCLPTFAQATGAPTPFGLVGFGIEMYSPVCAFACRQVLSSSKLNCSTPPVADRWHGGSGLGFDTSTECFATDDSYLLSLAWCMRRRCGSDDSDSSQEPWLLHRFWEHDVVGTDATLKYGFAEALKICGSGPKHNITAGEPLTEQSEVNVEDWSESERSMRDFAWVEKQHSAYGLALFLIMVCSPLVLSFAQYLASAILPGPVRLLLAHLSYAPLFRQRSFASRLFEGVESIGLGLLLLIVIGINILFAVLGYRTSMPNIYFDSTAGATQIILANRVGILAFANVPIIILYVSRNNPLIWLSGWSYATFTLLHRWVAYICIAQVTIHSAIYFAHHLHVLIHKFTQPYWNIGVLGTAVFIVMPLLSLPFLRRRWYEAFIDSHIAFAVGVVVTCYYHIYYKFQHHWGYENWIMLAAIIWGLDIAVRGVRIAANGVRTARVEEVDDEYMVVSVEGVRGTGMAHIYFPTLGWRLWENHPFSIMASVVEKRVDRVEKILEHGELVFDLVGSDDDSDVENGIEDDHDLNPEYKPIRLENLDVHATRQQGKESPLPARLELQSPTTIPTPHSATFMIPEPDEEEETSFGKSTSKRNLVTGLSFLIRRERGITARLFTKSLALPVLIEGPYPTSISISSAVLTSPHVVCIAGGVGIAATLPVLRARAAAQKGRTALYFGTRSVGLVRTCGLEEYMDRREALGIESFVRVGRRWDLEQVVLREAGCDEVGAAGQNERNGRGEGDVTIIVCGPPGMVAAVRSAVVVANGRRRRGNGVVRFIHEAFT